MSNRCRAGELASHLLNHLVRLGLTPEQLSWEFGDMTVISGNFQETGEGLYYAGLRYGSTFHFTHLPAEKLSVLALLIQNFLDLQDVERSATALAPVKLRPGVSESGTSLNVDAVIEFLDPLLLVAAASGPVTFHGKTYDFNTGSGNAAAAN